MANVWSIIGTIIIWLGVSIVVGVCINDIASRIKKKNRVKVHMTINVKYPETQDGDDDVQEKMS